MRLIDADGLIAELHNTIFEDGEDRSNVYRVVEGRPTIETKQKTGHWLVKGEFIDCSNCKKEKWSKVPYASLVKRFRYCPNCGARMEES